MENEPLAPSATNSLNKEVLVLKGPDGHEFSIKIPGAASQHVSVVDSPAHQEAIHHYNDVLATNPESSAIVNRVESSSFDRSVTEIGSLSLLAAGALVGALAMVRRKSSGHGGHGHGHGHSHYHGPKVPLL
ncbi:MAG TPA: hypothetical protein PKD20_03935, partial [Candidatus Saccharibacteria bacterium]|nr:hypothetical protein [Candidatus Saccharibacteria bacterium]